MAKRSTPTTSDETFGPWMIVELKSRQNQVDNRNQKEKKPRENFKCFKICCIGKG